MGGSTIRQNCKWIPTARSADKATGPIFDGTDHPDLLSALRAIGAYNTWVETRLLAIVSKWIDENRERVIDGMNDDEMNDFGAAVEKAYELLVADGFVAEREDAMKAAQIETKDINPLWQAETERRLAE